MRAESLRYLGPGLLATAAAPFKSKLDFWIGCNGCEFPKLTILDHWKEDS